MAACDVVLQRLLGLPAADEGASAGLECCRRLVVEANLSFQASATANNIILTMHLGRSPDEHMLINSQFVGECFSKLGVLDNCRERAAREKLLAHSGYAMCCDVGNKGTATNMEAFSEWDPALGKPVVRAGAAADLHGDQTASNLATVT